MAAQKEKLFPFSPGQIFYNDCAAEAGASSRVAEGKRLPPAADRHVKQPHNRLICR